MRGTRIGAPEGSGFKFHLRGGPKGGTEAEPGEAGGVGGKGRVNGKGETRERGEG